MPPICILKVPFEAVWVCCTTRELQSRSMVTSRGTEVPSSVITFPEMKISCCSWGIDGVFEGGGVVVALGLPVLLGWLELGPDFCAHALPEKGAIARSVSITNCLR